MSLPGILIVLAAIAGGFAMAGGHFPVLLQPSEFVVIIGAALGALITSSPGLMRKCVIHAVMSAIKENIPKKADYLELLKCQYELFMLARRQGVLGQRRVEREVRPPRLVDHEGEPERVRHLGQPAHVGHGAEVGRRDHHRAHGIGRRVERL